ncbi:hypothetical protein [Methylobacterium brachythecii]|uniref:Membrane-bound ClpP family serine protease n=1 Tax=Methylobacterium brachythecii TaxID=1176177 RepID=A0A7W6AN87_9HYPH|nr:hypothetical protein [Methylobacterium brachythecii]MBB3904929.1 membrane-bound ClpP family serine protease [Methylobacterium brachythecii]GLS46690.1 hypothetical protein GCM10007884_46840 [Methylobacterium brachythecii]
MIKVIGIAGALLFLAGSILLARLREARMPHRALFLLALGILCMTVSTIWWSEASRVDLP